MGLINRGRRLKIYNYDNYRCYLCDEKVIDTALIPKREQKLLKRSGFSGFATIDHVIAYSKCKYHLGNIRTCCERCNVFKSNNDISENLKYNVIKMRKSVVINNLLGY